MILFAGALVLGGVCGTAVYYGHADLLWLPVYVVGGAAAVVVALGVVVGVVVLVPPRRRPAPVVAEPVPVPASVADEVESWLREVS